MLCLKSSQTSLLKAARRQDISVADCIWFRVMYVTAIIMYSVFLTTVHCFENSKKRKFISSKFRKQEKFVTSKFRKSLQQGKFVTSKFRKNSHHFAAFSSKYHIERREILRKILPTYRRKFARTIDEIRQNSLSLLLHSTDCKSPCLISRTFFLKIQIKN